MLEVGSGVVLFENISCNRFIRSRILPFAVSSRITDVSEVIADIRFSFDTHADFVLMGFIKAP